MKVEAKKGLVRGFLFSEKPQGIKFFSLPDELKFPAFFVDFPLLRGGVRHLVEGNRLRRVSSNGKITTIVKNPLSPASLKLLMFLIAQKEIQVFMKIKDVARIVSSEKNLSRDFGNLLANIANCRIGVQFSEDFSIPDKLKPFFLPSMLMGRGVRRILNLVIVTSITDVIREERRSWHIRVNFSPEFMSFCNASPWGYVKVKTDVLKELTNKHSIELFVYLLCLKKQRKHLKEYLTHYFLGCSENFLFEKVQEKQVDAVLKSIRRIYERSLQALEKMKELRVIESYSFKEGKLFVGGGKRTAPFFESLLIEKPQSQ